jgi:hypothetical protein
MRQEYKFISFDNKIFDTEEECVIYEQSVMYDNSDFTISIKDILDFLSELSEDHTDEYYETDYDRAKSVIDDLLASIKSKVK